MRRQIGTLIGVLALSLPAQADEIISGPDAQKILALQAQGQLNTWCKPVETVREATTGAIVQQTCICAAHVAGMGGSTGSEAVVDLEWGPAQPCPIRGAGPPAGLTAQQIADARNQINWIDQFLPQLEYRLQHLRDNVNRDAYQNNDAYRSAVDNWVAQWGQYGARVRQQLQALRQGDENIIAGGGAIGTPILGPDGKPIPGPGGVIMNPVKTSDLSYVTGGEPPGDAPVPPVSPNPAPGPAVRPPSSDCGILGQGLPGENC